MKLDTLEALLIDELKDLWSAEKQILAGLPKMIKAAGARSLKKAFAVHERQTRQHVKRLERVLKSLGASPGGKKCVGMEALLKEGTQLIKEKPAQHVLDAGLISARATCGALRDGRLRHSSHVGEAAGIRDARSTAAADAG